MPDIVIVILAVIFVLGIAINIHEFGHFIVAKMLGMRVEAYSFFGIGKLIWYKQIGHTKYGISPIPIGAYVKLYGDEATSSLEGGSSKKDVGEWMDERNIGEAESSKARLTEPVPASELYELRPRWQKFLVMIGGPFMNIVLALAIPFIGALMYGVPVMPAPITGVVVPGGAGAQAGIQPGDRIVSFDGVENPTWQRIESDAALSPEKAVPVVVERNGERINLTVTPRKDTFNGQPLGRLDFEPDSGEEPVVVSSTQAGMPAAESGLKSGDRILSFNGNTIRNRESLMMMIRESKDAPIKLSVDRAGERLEIDTRAKVGEDGIPRIGIGFGSTPATREPATFGTAAAFAYNANMEILRMTGKAFGQVGTGERKASDTISGPIGIVQIISQVVLQAGWAGLFSILMVISLNLGIFNLLPIPMLDGGQIMVLGIEEFLSWFKLKMSELVRERIQLAGLGFILLLMVFVMFNDISRLLR